MEAECLHVMYLTIIHGFSVQGAACRRTRQPSAAYVLAFAVVFLSGHPCQVLFCRLHQVVLYISGQAYRARHCRACMSSTEGISELERREDGRPSASWHMFVLMSSSSTLAIKPEIDEKSVLAGAMQVWSEALTKPESPASAAKGPSHDDAMEAVDEGLGGGTGGLMAGYTSVHESPSCAPVYYHSKPANILKAIIGYAQSQTR